MQFKDLNFKISIIGALHEMDYYKEEVTAIKEANSDWSENYKPIPAVVAFYANLEIDPAYLNEIDYLAPDGGDLCYQFLFNVWDGEDGQFDITSIEGIELLENLEVFQPVSMISLDGIDFSPLLKCKNLKTIDLNLFIENHADMQVIEQLKARGVDVN